MPGLPAGASDFRIPELPDSLLEKSQFRNRAVTFWETRQLSSSFQKPVLPRIGARILGKPNDPALILFVLIIAVCQIRRIGHDTTSA